MAINATATAASEYLILEEERFFVIVALFKSKM
jgi:hypothetical protein